MSVKLVKDAMQKFLMDGAPQVLCVSGRWGTGKTHTWFEALRQTEPHSLPMSKHAYVSLFGIKDANDILQAAYINSDELNPSMFAKVGGRLSASTGLSLAYITRKTKILSNALADHASIPWISGLGGVARAVMSTLVNHTVVCIDDIERKGPNVTITEIMGVVAFLREVRECKVVLILNEDNLQEVDRQQFALYSEKVIDMTFKFVQTAEEAAAIAFTGTDELSQRLSQATTELGITNIRILMKISIFARNLMKLLNNIDDEVAKRVLRSLVVLAWSILSPGDEGAPTLEYLLEKRQIQSIGSKKTEFTDAETAWGALLDLYGFTHADEFDRALIEDLKRGYFDWDNLKIYVEKYLTDAQNARAQNALEKAWKYARSSFDDNASQVGTAIYNASIEHIAYLTPNNLNGTVSLLKGIGLSQEAKILLAKFMETHADKDIFDWRHGIFGPSVDDPDVISAFDAKQATKPKLAPLSPFAAAARIRAGGWSSRDEDALRSLSVDDFEALIKGASENDLHDLVYGGLQWFHIRNAPPDKLEISNRVKEALIRIGRSSPINRFRVQALGINVADPESDFSKASEN